MNRNRQLITSDEAIEADGQHTEPCSDCPWRRESLAGWLGLRNPQQWVADAHGETNVECHVLHGAQCAGIAVYRRNVCKNPRDPEILQLEADREEVFASPQEFIDHHERKT